MFLIPNLNSGGAERVAVQLSEQLSRMGNDVTIVMLRGEVQFYEPAGHVRVIALKLPHIPVVSKLLRGMTVWGRLRHLYRKYETDVVIGFLNYSNIFAVASTMFSDTKVIISERNAPMEWDRHPEPFLRLRDFLYPKADAFYAQTPQAAEEARKRFGLARIRVINNPLKPLRIDADIRKEKLILNVGRLVPQKGQAMLLEAFAALDAPGWKLCILGEGELRTVLEEKARELGIGDRLVMPGEVRDVDTWLAKASVFAFPSLFEGIPNALIEAMASGLPAVSFDCETGPSDLIEHEKNGFLVPVGDVAALRRRLQRLIDDEALRSSMGAAAGKIAAMHDPREIASQLLSLCSEVVSDSGSGGK